LIPDILNSWGKWRASDPAVIAGDTKLSWSEFNTTTNRVANGLVSIGIQPGDRIAVNMSNSIEMVEVLLGIVKAGGCSVPLNLSIPDDAVVGMIEDSGARALFASSDQLVRLDNLLDRLPEEVQRNVFCTDAASDRWQDYRIWADGQSEAFPALDIAGETPMNIIYSSGTTGLPKGIIATQQGRFDWAYDLSVTYRFHCNCRTLAGIGLYSNISWVSMLATFLVGGTLIVADNRFDARKVLEIIERHRITHTALVPVQFQRLLECEGQDGFDLSSMECAITVGSPMHVELKRSVFNRLNGALYELYGLTEGLITVMEPESMPDHWNSVGRPILGTDMEILGDDDQILPRGESGEIVGAARFVMAGYHNRDEATAEAIWIAPNGATWLKTGDIGYFDEEGYLYLVDRKKDMILSGAQNIYPADIEAVLLTHEQVSEAAVVGVPSKRWGETPLAIIVPAAGTVADPDKIRHWLNDRVGKQQRVVAVELIAELPRNPNGKILKRELRADYQNRCFD
jgi:acyl-CoA synthetase (AMP-forming)/AMP-acid ligase II